MMSHTHTHTHTHLLNSVNPGVSLQQQGGCLYIAKLSSHVERCVTTLVGHVGISTTVQQVFQTHCTATLKYLVRGVEGGGGERRDGRGGERREGWRLESQSSQSTKAHMVKTDVRLQ